MAISIPFWHIMGIDVTNVESDWSPLQNPVIYSSLKVIFENPQSLDNRFQEIWKNESSGDQ